MCIYYSRRRKRDELFVSFPLSFLSFSLSLPSVSPVAPRRDVPAERTHFIAKLRPSDPVKCFRFLLGGNRKSRAVNQQRIQRSSLKFSADNPLVSRVPFPVAVPMPKNFSSRCRIDRRERIKNVYSSHATEIVRPSHSFVTRRTEDERFPPAWIITKKSGFTLR